MNREIRSLDDLLRLLDRLFSDDGESTGSADPAQWWDRFYADRDRPIPFFAPGADENLESWLNQDLLRGGRALDLGCGPGRNALRLAAAGFTVDAVDISPAAVAWARERATHTGADIRFHCADIFAVDLPHDSYDLVYDSGCLHHLPPHRRISYLALLERHLTPGGHFGLVCFAAGADGSRTPDLQLYRDGSLHGGLAYAPDELRHLFDGYTEIELRHMVEQPPGADLFGVPFLLAALFQRPHHR
jgi:SAM-dependent methyltransferase